jgi:hypothetical protein
MLELEERLLSSMVEKSFAMVSFWGLVDIGRNAAASPRFLTPIYVEIVSTPCISG